MLGSIDDHSEMCTVISNLSWLGSQDFRNRAVFEDAADMSYLKLDKANLESHVKLKPLSQFVNNWGRGCNIETLVS